MIQVLFNLMLRQMVVLIDCRCSQCGKLLGKNLQGKVEIKCTRCKTINSIQNTGGM